MAYIGKNPRLKSIVSNGDTLANLTAEPRIAGRLVYANGAGEDKFYFDNGVSLTELGSGGGGGAGTDNVIADDLVDLSSSTNYFNPSASTQLDVKNGANGAVTSLIVTNNTVGNVTISWPISLNISVLDNNKVVAPNTTTTYTLVQSNNGVYVYLEAEGIAPAFPSGSDGDLTILNGETVQLVSGDIKDYANIDIQTGGTLEILDNANSWNPVELYCVSSFNLDGELVYRSTERGTTSRSGNFFDNTAYSFTTTQAAGGNGGAGGSGGNQGGGGGGGGNGSSGYGGGGGGGGAGQSPAAVGGGGGSTNGNGGGGGSTGGAGGAGNVTNAAGSNGGESGSAGFGKPGGTGGGSGGGGGGGYNDLIGFGWFFGGGGGGGGGHKGNHGGLLYINSFSTITGTGLVNMSGTSGFNGGNGSAGRTSSPGLIAGGGGGGGAGGGAGGNGGYLVVRAPSYSFSTDISGGAGSSGGSGGAGAGSGVPAGSGGAIGSTGNAGSVTNL